jgi:hypothetical protein
MGRHDYEYKPPVPDLIEIGKDVIRKGVSLLCSVPGIEFRSSISFVRGQMYGIVAHAVTGLLGAFRSPASCGQKKFVN